MAVAHNQSMTWQLRASTLGAPYDSMAQIAAICQEHGVSSIEVAVGDEMMFTMNSTDDELVAMRGELAERGPVGIFSVDSRVQVCNPARSEDELLEDLLHCLHMADVLGASYVRVFPGAPLAPHSTPDRLPGLNLAESASLADISRRGAAIIAKSLPLADKLGIQPVLETHDSHPSGERSAIIHAEIDRLAPGNRVGAIWDLAHPWRVGENPETTFAYIGTYLLEGRGFVQIKDCAFPGDQTPVLQSRGRVPLTQACRLLKKGGYRGPLSLEWERRWYPQVEPLDEALAAARSAIAALPEQSQLQ